MLKPVLSSSLLNFQCQIRTMSHQVLRDIFLKSVESVKPQTLIRKQVKVRDDGHLAIGGATYPLRKPCHIVGFGKAVLGMALEMERLLGDHLKMGVVTVPEGIFEKFPIRIGSESTKITFVEGAKNNIPDEKAISGALKIKELIEGLTGDDLVVVLVSGGGSALLPLPRPPITLQEKQGLIKQLASRGADIFELNCVRKRISALKGGGLAEMACPATVVSLILSDIVGDPLDFIASGPTTPNMDEDGKAMGVIEKFGLRNEIPSSVREALMSKSTAKSMIRNGKYEHVTNFIIGNNSIAAEAAKNHAISLGLQSAILSTTVLGNVSELADIYANLAAVAVGGDKSALKAFLQGCRRSAESGGGLLCVLDDATIEEITNFDFSKGVCLVAAGEPTVVVRGGGRGGRNQQLALEFSVRVNKLDCSAAAVDISFLSGGTDGIDGPTDAAGAIGSSDLVHDSLAAGNIIPSEYLDNNDSNGFYVKYRDGECLIKIGHTGTNVMDIHLMLIKPSKN